MIILGIETSCDETSVAVVKSAEGQRPIILANVIASQIDMHKQYGGVVPEVAARNHLEVILPLIEKALELATSKMQNVKSNNKLTAYSSSLIAQSAFKQIDCIAVTYGPGLPGALLIGVLTARTLSMVLNKPLVAVDHVHAHAYTAWLEVENMRKTDSSLGIRDSMPSFPSLALIVSGGHTQLVLFRNHFNYKVLGQTLDDAAGEAFDKVARLLGLGYRGPAVAKAAQKGDPNKYKLPKVHTSGLYDFSFSGLKTAVLRHAQILAQKDYSFPSFELAKLLTEQQINDTAASFQKAAVDYLVTKTVKAAKEYQPKSVVLAGGVAANTLLREELHKKFGKNLFIPPVELCTDNAAMIAGLGYQHFKVGKLADPLTLESNPSLSM